MHILLIDDNPDDRVLAVRALKRAWPDVTVTEVLDAPAFADALVRGGFDAVVTDYQLRWSEGLAVLARVRQRHPSCPVVMFTGTGTEEVAVEAMKAGLDDYLIKSPRHYARLPLALRNALERAEARRRVQEAHAERDALLVREQEARRVAEAANRVKDEFLANLSHELRTPLASIVGWVDLLRLRVAEPAALAHGLEVIERNAGELTRLVSELLDLAQVITGNVRVDLRPVDVVPIVEAALDTLRPAAAAKRIAITTELDPGAGLVSGDPGRLQQVTWNLLSNAIKFTPSDGRVAVGVARVGPVVEIVVIDTGVGMVPAAIPRIFDRLWQADSSPTRAHEGLGVGLAIVRHLVELHGGTVEAESAGPGLGATFRVRLPRLEAVPDAVLPPLPSVAQMEPRSTTTELVGVRVVLVEDQADMRDLLAIVLEHAGARVEAVATASAALAAVRREPPDVLIADIRLSQGDGYTQLREIRALGPASGGAVPAIALTAYAGVAERERASAAGYQLHLAKPVDVARVVAAVAELARQASVVPAATDRRGPRS